MNHANNAQVRENNANRIRKILFNGEIHTRDTLADATELSNATCRNILLDMLQTGEIIECSHGEPNSGRPARRFCYNPEFLQWAFFRIKASRVGRTLEIIVTDAVGKIVFQKESLPIPVLSTETICKTAIDTVTAYPRIAGIAFSYPGVVLHGKTSCWGDIDELNGFDLAGMIQNATQKMTLVENDINLSAQGYRNRCCEKNSDFAYIGFPANNLPGCGLIVDGRLLRGTRGFAGEILYIQNRTYLEQQKILENQSGISNMIQLYLRSITALLDPKLIVIASSRITRVDEAKIRERIAGTIRPELLPELRFISDYLPDNFAGMLELVRAQFFKK